MKVSRILSNRGKGIPARHASKGCVAAVLAVLIGISWDMVICRAQQPGSESPGSSAAERERVGKESATGVATARAGIGSKSPARIAAGVGTARQTKAGPE